MEVKGGKIIARDLILNNKKGGEKFCLKVDIWKVFDQINKGFILGMMKEMGFPSQWIKWI